MWIIWTAEDKCEGFDSIRFGVHIQSIKKNPLPKPFLFGDSKHESEAWIFTSPFGAQIAAEFWLQRWYKNQSLLFAVGGRTSDVLKKMGWQEKIYVPKIPSGARGILDFLPILKKIDNIFIPGALKQFFDFSKFFHVHKLPLYETSLIKISLNQVSPFFSLPSIICFCSPTAVKGFFSNFSPRLLPWKAVVMGQSTYEAVHKIGFSEIYFPDEMKKESLLKKAYELSVF